MKSIPKAIADLARMLEYAGIATKEEVYKAWRIGNTRQIERWKQQLAAS